MNTKEPELIDRFIELRAQGRSLASIAAELNVSKPTLIKWSRKHHLQISNLRAIESEALADQLRLSRRICLENLGEDAHRIREELARRSLADIPTARLVTLSALVRAEALRLSGPLRLSEQVSSVGPDEERFADPTISWEI